MMSERSSMRMQSTSCCFSSGGDADPATSFSLGCDMATSSVTLPLRLAAHHTAPQLPGSHPGALVDRVGEPGFVEVERCDGRAVPQSGGPVLDAGIHLRIHGAKHRRLERRPA